MVLLELEDLSPLGVVLNFWVEELRIFDVTAVEILVSGGETNFGHSEPEREETVLAPPPIWLYRNGSQRPQSGRRGIERS